MNYFEKYIQDELKKETKMLKKCKKYRASLNSFAGKSLMACYDSKKNFTRLYVHSDGDPANIRRYCGKKEVDEIRGISHCHFIDETISRLENNIKALQLLLKNYHSYRPEDVSSIIAQVYDSSEDLRYLFYETPSSDQWLKDRLAEKAAHIKQHGVYKPEHLRHKAIDGTLCRSKNEVSIYNFLLQGGFTFVYEYPLEVNGKLCYPDFLILCDDGTVIIIEHLGMADSHRYLTRQDEKIEDYIHDGWVPNVNIFLTFDDYNGNLNMEAIAWLITARVRKV